MDRRAFLRTLGVASSLLAAGCGSDLVPLASGASSKALAGAGDSLAMQFYKSLTPQQREAICLPSWHMSRDRISNWWYVLPRERIHGTFSADQKELIQTVFNSLHSPEHQDAVAQHMVKDQYGDPDNSPSVAFFGTPEDEDFEFIYTGHHVTRRCQVHSKEGRGFGSRPVFYGTFVDSFHETKDHPGNPYWYQGRIFNSFFSELSGAEQAQALVASDPRSEDDALVIQKSLGDWPGLSSTSLSRDHKKLLLDSMAKMLAMFRPADVAATLETILNHNIIDELHISGYQGRHDIGGDRVWDTWQIEGPRMVWYFRGQPHIHCYFHLEA